MRVRTLNKTIAALSAVGVLAFVLLADRSRRIPNASQLRRSRHLDRLLSWALCGGIRC